MKIAAAFALFGLVGCNGETPGPTPKVYQQGDCYGSLEDAGFSSLAGLPTTALCTESAADLGSAPKVDKAQCGGVIVVEQWLQVGACVAFWYFAPTTGALLGLGRGCEDT